MMKRSSETVVLADHTKFDRPSLSVYGPWLPQVLLVCDQVPKGELRAALEHAGARTLLC
jgi:DeoR/GlpR family transcriptional regulator of sugar metabolism